MPWGSTRLRVVAAPVLWLVAALAATAWGGERSQDECRKRAADFIGVAPGELELRSYRGILSSDRYPTLYVFLLPYPTDTGEEDYAGSGGRVTIEVNTQTGEVTNVEYDRRRYTKGTRQIGEAEAKENATAYLKQHWRHFARARFYWATKPFRPDATAGVPNLPAPEQWFRWVVEDANVRVGEASVRVNLTTGEVTAFTQYYYPAEGLLPARVTKQQAINATLSKLTDEQRTKAVVQEAYLAPRWYKGQVRLQWVVYLKAPASMPPGYRMTPPMRTYGLQLDAHTGEVYMEVK